MKLSSVRDFANFIGCQRSQVSNWLQGYHYPRVPDMSVLCEKLNNEVTLDWIYRGVPSGMPYAMTIHLTNIMEGIEGPAAPPHEPKATPSIAPIAKAAACDGAAVDPEEVGEGWSGKGQITGSGGGFILGPKQLIRRVSIAHGLSLGFRIRRRRSGSRIDDS